MTGIYETTWHKQQREKRELGSLGVDTYHGHTFACATTAGWIPFQTSKTPEPIARCSYCKREKGNLTDSCVGCGACEYEYEFR